MGLAVSAAVAVGAANADARLRFVLALHHAERWRVEGDGWRVEGDQSRVKDEG